MEGLDLSMASVIMTTPHSCTATQPHNHTAAQPHSHLAASTDLELVLLGFMRSAHPPYFPDLAPIDFAYFHALEELRGRFADVERRKLAVPSFYLTLSSQWFVNTFSQLLNRHRKCISIRDRQYCVTLRRFWYWPRHTI